MAKDLGGDLGAGYGGTLKDLAKSLGLRAEIMTPGVDGRGIPVPATTLLPASKAVANAADVAPGEVCDGDLVVRLVVAAIASDAGFGDRGLSARGVLGARHWERGRRREEERVD